MIAYRSDAPSARSSELMRERERYRAWIFRVVATAGRQRRDEDERPRKQPSLDGTWRHHVAIV
jgi:hypothetical protein